jgi:hypothetical protein
MKTVEDAYQLIGAALLGAALPNWSEIILNTKILGKNCSAMSTEQIYLNSLRENIDIDFSKVFELSDACIFLRDDLLATTKERIWGLTYKLFPDGKIKIEYDYNKPADYEETDEVITGEEMNQSLTDLFPKK